MAIVVAHLSGWTEHGALSARWWSSQLTGIALASSGSATVLLAAGRSVAGQLVAALVLLFAALLGMGHVFPRADLYERMPGTGVAIPTVLAFLALSLGQLLSEGQRGFAHALSARSTAGRTGLRLLVGGIAGTFLLAIPVGLAADQEWFDAQTAVLLVAWGAMVLLGGTLWSLAVAADRAQAAAAAAERNRNEVRQMVVAAITHDLRTPLQSASLSAHVLEHVVDDPRGQAAVARIHRGHRRLDRLLRSLLDNMSVGAGQSLDLRFGPVALDQVVREVVAENEILLGERVVAAGTAQGWWDADALFRVIENLLLNAVKYGAAQTPIDCRIAVHGGTATLEVHNRGDAIAPAEWEAIFQPFARGSGARQAQGTGWGVGLAYARAVANGHGGSLKVVASGEEGTRLRLCLPLDSRTPGTAARQS